MSDLPPEILARIQVLTTAIVNASAAEDAALHDSLCETLRALRDEEVKLGRSHPFLTELAADFAADSEEAVRLYELALEEARACAQEPTHTKLIGLAAQLLELDRRDEARARLREGRAEAVRRQDAFWIGEADRLLGELAGPGPAVSGPPPA